MHSLIWYTPREYHHPYENFWSRYNWVPLLYKTLYHDRSLVENTLGAVTTVSHVNAYLSFSILACSSRSPLRGASTGSL